jgi:hypothetical protein
VELREAAAGGGDSVRVTETPQPNSSVSPPQLRRTEQNSHMMIL